MAFHRNYLDLGASLAGPGPSVAIERDEALAEVARLQAERKVITDLLDPAGVDRFNTLVAGWTVTVSRSLGDGDWVAMFNVGVQHFTLARVAHDEDEAESHVRFIVDQFVNALATLGLRQTT